MKKLLAGLILGGCYVSAQAGVVYLKPNLEQSSYAIGEMVTLDLMFDFSDNPSIGGGVDVYFDPSGLEFKSWTAEALGDSNFRRAPDVLSGKLNGIAFGNFAGLPGKAKVGALTFETLQSGSWEIELGENEAPAGGFYAASSFSLLPVQFNDHTVTVNAVPIPAAAWLFGSTLLGWFFRSPAQRKA